ncbi:zinc finger protein 664 isoform X2 [Heterocephalus glaber]|uniref:Zinc finger protein 664 isoform X2 n=1 Tax=Heterocephalus glaber TaxID=10181 RepID=A0AAX6QU67_HETGA|nr:zinc finger protein 664 isoform X2 [Heterocephalus glaber]
MCPPRWDWCEDLISHCFPHSETVSRTQAPTALQLLCPPLPLLECPGVSDSCHCDLQTQETALGKRAKGAGSSGPKRRLVSRPFSGARRRPGPWRCCGKAFCLMWRRQSDTLTLPGSLRGLTASQRHLSLDIREHTGWPFL